MTRTLIKLIDSSLLPAGILICGKIIGIVITNWIFNLNFGIVSDPNNFFSISLIYENEASQIISVSYSNLIMYMFLFIGFSVILYRALFLHSSHISPTMLSKLASNNLLNTIANSFEIYYSASIWLIMLWLAFGIIFVNSLIEKSYLWTASLTFVTTLISTVLILRDVTKEIYLAKKNIKYGEEILS